ncbi:hypothetical protein GOBAR_DD33060 [Gossypium barbadense]|nr:hypothetical protein GOBAR_DD33060 [Gossypium barbadense]
MPLFHMVIEVTKINTSSKPCAKHTSTTNPWSRSDLKSEYIGEELPRRVVGGREDLLERIEFSNPLAWERLLDLLTPTLTVVVVDHHNKDYGSNFTNQNKREREFESDQVKRECSRKSASDYEMPLPCISFNGVDIDASRSGSSSGRATTAVHHSPSRCLSGFSFFSDTDRDEIGGSSSNGRNQDDSLIKRGEYWAQHDELHGACFNASETLVQLRLLFMERVCQGLDSRPSSLGGNQAMLIQLPSHILPLNHDPLILPAGRVGDHVDNDHHGVRPLNHDPLISSARRVGLTNYPNPKIAQKGRGKFHITFLAVGFIEFRNRETFPDETEACKHCNCRRSRCLKLYCECFAAGIYCKDYCACDNCLNKPDYEDIVLDIRLQIELLNPLAFAPPIVNPPNDSPNVTRTKVSLLWTSAIHINPMYLSTISWFCLQ